MYVSHYHLYFAVHYTFVYISYCTYYYEMLDITVNYRGYRFLKYLSDLVIMVKYDLTVKTPPNMVRF